MSRTFRSSPARLMGLDELSKQTLLASCRLEWSSRSGALKASKRIEAGPGLKAREQVARIRRPIVSSRVELDRDILSGGRAGMQNNKRQVQCIIITPNCVTVDLKSCCCCSHLRRVVCRLSKPAKLILSI